jgi:hypothetical protein
VRASVPQDYKPNRNHWYIWVLPSAFLLLCLGRDQKLYNGLIKEFSKTAYLPSSLLLTRMGFVTKCFVTTLRMFAAFVSKKKWSHPPFVLVSFINLAHSTPSVSYIYVLHALSMDHPFHPATFSSLFQRDAYINYT